MSFRLNPFKVMRAVGIVAIIVYGVVLVTGYKKSRKTTTDSVTKDMKIRKKDFYNSEEYKNNLTLPTQVIENNNETVVKEIEQAKTAQPVNLKNNNSNQANSSEQKSNTNNEVKKREEQARLEAQKKLEEQKRQEAVKQEARQAEIKKAQQEKERKQAEERAKEEAAKKSQVLKGPKKYIQVASVSSEASAKAMAKKLGGNFYYKKTKVNGKTAYVIMSNMTDNPNTLKAMENQAKSKSGGRYMIRSVGK